MSRIGWLLTFLLSAATAHPGHDAPDPHLHEFWEVAVLLAIVAVSLIIYGVRGRRPARQSQLEMNKPQVPKSR